MRRCIMFAASCGVTFVLASAGAGRANAIEVECIEASKYKYLYQLFGNDRRKLADFLQVPSARLPDGELCRAALITGRIEPTAYAREQGWEVDDRKLMAVIEQNQGWLAHLYLASSGGNVAVGLALAQLSRLFWLKTQAPNAKSFVYQPDFVLAPPARSGDATQHASASGLDVAAYARTVGPLAQVSITKGSGRCASACTFIHVAGIDREGVVFVHRGRRSKARNKGGGINVDKSMTETIEGLQRTEARIMALYRNMDSGDHIIRLFQATPTATVAEAATDRFPRYISDFLRAKCGADATQLQEREVKIRAEIADSSKPAGAEGVERLGKELADLLARRAKVEQCVAAAHEKERLAQFAKYCTDRCDRGEVVSVVRAKLRDLGPTTSRRPVPDRPVPPGQARSPRDSDR